MYNHRPDGYRCPFCLLVAGGGDELSGPPDVVRRTATAVALISPRWWPHNHGHVLVVPTAHVENLYDLPPRYGHGVHDLVREVAIAIRATYGCAGTSVRQHNEPAGNQDVWHHHVHVFARYAGDDLYRLPPLPGYASAEQRLPYARRLRAYFDTAG
ncbi:HIT family protein [Catellatospora tritici]|uniref:HIT family protein n=1 Tax=Catellatospora tritici TaxID=2851566 RepID=UPI0027DFA820|nr:HIT family protein [Catellatospora tritici]